MCALIAILATVTLIAGRSKDPIVGRWEGLGGVMNGEYTPMESEDFYLEVNENGRFHFSFFSTDYEGSWNIQEQNVGDEGSTLYYFQTETSGVQNFYATVMDDETGEHITFGTEDGEIGFIFARS